MTDVTAQTGSERTRRLIHAFTAQCGSILVTLFGLCAITFVIGRLLPLDPVLAVLGDDASQEAYLRMSEEMGLNLPLWQQFVHFMWDLVRFDFGRSITTGHFVTDDLIRVMGATIELSVIALLIATILGIPLGVLAAAKYGRWQDHFVRVLTLIGYSAPVFWLGLIGLIMLYAKLGWVGGAGRLDVLYQYDFTPMTGLFLLDSALQGQWEVFGNLIQHIILPASVLGFTSMAYIARMTRSFMLEQLNQEYVLTAKAKGASALAVVWRHAFRNIAVQLLTVVALTFAFLLEGTVLVETVFAWPGFGRYFTTGLMAGDMNIVVPCTLIVGIMFIAINLISDLLYRTLDPRLRK